MSQPNPDPPESADEYDQLASELAELLKVTPPGDHPIVAEHLASGVVVAIGNALFDIRQMVAVHHDMAPVTAHRVMTFAQHTAQSAMSWIKEWAQ